ncbi:MAG: SGNH/GDSL hydrolase family protein [Oscillospiraceae bacterium]|nr:SGNH/GDSL hydrolase family protein [Oscillospiraceae bacterium]
MRDKLYVYGDSLMKATVPDENFRYHFRIGELMEREPAPALEVVNRAKMGATIRKGQSLVARDLEQGAQGRWALIGYGGNDCDFDWSAVAAAPDGEHCPKTELPEFLRILKETAAALLEKGIQPLLMTLPPIDAARYLDFICRRGLDRGKILQWLGDCQMIYRYQELYSDSVAQLATAEGLPLIDVRRAFLGDRTCAGLIAADGIHLTMDGYQRLYGTIGSWMKKNVL